MVKRISLAETFEGLGLGSRLAYLDVGEKYNWIAIAGAVIYSLSTPLGVAIGLGIRSSYNPGSATASIVTGILDSISAGILVYTGLVEVRPILSTLFKLGVDDGLQALRARIPL